MSTTKMLAAGMAVAIVTFGISIGGTSPAEAHVTCIERSWGTACANDTHRAMAVFDDDNCDGHEVRATVQWSNGSTANVFDPDGCGPSHGIKWFATAYVRYKLCADGIGCTAWKAV